MRYLDLFAGYGGFSLGIKKAYETIGNTNVQKVGGRETTAEGELQKDGERLHTVPRETTLLTDNRDNELSNPSTNERQPYCIGFSEIDRYATEIYKKHFNHKEYGDIKNIIAGELPDFDLLTAGFPCQAFSIAGKRGGFEDTRGTLIFEVFRIIAEKHPRLVLLENVKGLLSHDGGRTFKTIITSLAELGYAVEWQVLNAKNFGVPQNRERVFIIGHLGGFGGQQVFPIGENVRENSGFYEEQEEVARTVNATYSRNQSDAQYIKNCAGGGRCSGVDKKQNWDSFEYEGKIRRLTPTECERLMGLPDGWTEGVSDSQRYKLCGNGVVVNVVEEIIKRLIAPPIRT